MDGAAYTVSCLLLGTGCVTAVIAVIQMVMLFPAAIFGFILLMWLFLRETIY